MRALLLLPLLLFLPLTASCALDRSGLGTDGGPTDSCAPTGAEACDGRDNDCDGEIDEALDEQGCGLGICAGTRRCEAGAWGDCGGGQEPVAESCGDELDNDCDGMTEEGCDCEEGATRTCGAGACVGTQTCIDRVWDDCEGPGPGPESCDNTDEDCDGIIDEGLSRGCGLGICAGVEICAGGVWGACAGGMAPRAETCDGFDEDCDDLIDEELSRACGGAGICAGAEICAGGAWGACGGAMPMRAESCDGLDEDCDSTVDEEVTQACGVGACVGVETCLAGAFGACDGPAPGVEACDGVVDEDCDGAVDESCCSTEGATQLCGAGACAGSQTCTGGMWSACSGPAPAAEVCNASDEDCDGHIDEAGACASCAQFEYGGHTYQRCDAVVGWVVARDGCRAAGYELVSVDDAAEQSAVAAVVGADGNSHWIGLNDRGTEGTYVWVSGSTASYRNWNSGEPNDGGFFGAEDCVEMRGDGLWNDLDCDEGFLSPEETRRYVCEVGP